MDDYLQDRLQKYEAAFAQVILYLQANQPGYAMIYMNRFSSDMERQANAHERNADGIS